ncbi:MAG: hypothetical protein PHN44_03655 [Candidatus Marinimicrobia bacterium]|nr:hypothetical protein [Candidatus Neomarinimicrobiota bacterium]
MSRFTLKQYEDLVDSLSPLQFVTCAEFDKTPSPCVTMRHDIDALQYEFPMAEIEMRKGVRSTFFVRSKHLKDSGLIKSLKELQSKGFEIGLHNDCFSEIVGVGGNYTDGVAHLEWALEYLRDNGFNIRGIANHGDGSLRAMGRNNDDILPGCLDAIGIGYEAYRLNYDYYLSDIGHPTDMLLYYDTVCPGKPINYRRYPVDIDNIYEFIHNGKTEILTHPQHWE